MTGGDAFAAGQNRRSTKRVNTVRFVAISCFVPA
jgi:hypothetical protein